MKNFSSEVGQISHCEHDQRFNDTDMIGETSQKRSEKTEENTNARTANTNQYKAKKA